MFIVLLKLRCHPDDSLTVYLEQQCNHLPLASQADRVELPGAIIEAYLRCFYFYSSLLR